MTGTGNFNQIGTGQTNFNVANAYTGNTNVSAGVLNVTSTGVINSTSGTVGRVTVGNIAGNAVLTVNGGTINALIPIAVGGGVNGLQIGTTSGANGSLIMNSGTLNVTAEMWIGTTPGAYASFTLNGGSANIGSFLSLTRGGGVGVLNVNSGSTAVATNSIVVGAAVGGTGQMSVANFTGNSITTATAGGLYVGRYTSGVATVSGNASVSALGTLGVRFADTATTSSGVLNLNGGTITTTSVSEGAGTSGVMNFNGGTLVAAGDNANFFGGVATANVQSGGARIDDGGHNITVSQVLSALRLAQA